MPSSMRSREANTILLCIVSPATTNNYRMSQSLAAGILANRCSLIPANSIDKKLVNVPFGSVLPAGRENLKGIL